MNSIVCVCLFVSWWSYLLINSKEKQLINEFQTFINYFHKTPWMVFESCSFVYLRTAIFCERLDFLRYDFLFFRKDEDKQWSFILLVWKTKANDIYMNWGLLEMDTAPRTIWSIVNVFVIFLVVNHIKKTTHRT
jgi:hypothetical protein